MSVSGSKFATSDGSFTNEKLNSANSIWFLIDKKEDKSMCQLQENLTGIYFYVIQLLKIFNKIVVSEVYCASKSDFYHEDSSSFFVFPQEKKCR